MKPITAEDLIKEWFLNYGERPILWGDVPEPLRNRLRDTYYSDYVDYIHRDSNLLRITPEALEIIKGK